MLNQCSRSAVRGIHIDQGGKILGKAFMEEVIAEYEVEEQVGFQYMQNGREGEGCYRNKGLKQGFLTFAAHQTIWEDLKKYFQSLN